jgi:TRAP transporter TAXI family solute receptor
MISSEQPSKTKFEVQQNKANSVQKLENTLILFKEKLGLSIFTLSIIAGVGLTWQLLRKYPPKHNLTMATFAQGGEYYAFGQAFSQIVTKHNPSISIKVLATNGSVENQQLLKEGSVDLALIENDTPLNPSTRAIAFLFPELFHLMVRRESNINQVKDLRGKRIALMPEGSRSHDLFWELVAHYGLDEDDFETISLPPPQANEALSKGKVDALFQVSALRNQGLLKLLQNPDIKLLPIDQGNALQLSLPALEASLIPKGTYNGAIPIPQEDLPTVAVRAVLVTDLDLDPHLVHEITRILFETRNDLAKQYPQAAMIPVGDSLQHGSFMFHPGAKIYYEKDKPSFLVKYAESIGLLISVTMLALSGIWQLKMRLQGKQKNRADMYNLELLNLIAQIHSVKS